jgi:hypothetical protein
MFFCLKYEYNGEMKQVSNSIKYLIQIVINTLNFQYHKCEITNLEAIGINSLNKLQYFGKF